MSIIFEELTIKNFLSVGNNTQAIDFRKQDVTLILGQNIDAGNLSLSSRNGTGKTLIANALSYALFGEALNNIKQDNLINNINKKNMLVSLSFLKDGVRHRIERGRKPSVFKYEIEGRTDSEAQGDSRETQKDIGKFVIGMSNNMFKHIVALNTYTQPFLSSSAGIQRDIMEQLVGITILSEKAENLKKQIKKTKEDLIKENAIIATIKTSNDNIQKSIDHLKITQKRWVQMHEQSLVELKESIKELSKIDIEREIELHTLHQENEKQRSLHKQLSGELTTLETVLQQSSKNRSQLIENISKINNNKCHACNQKLKSHDHDRILSDLEEQLGEADDYANSISEGIEILKNQLSDIKIQKNMPAPFYSNIDDARTHQTNLLLLESELESKSALVDPYEDQILNLQNTALQAIDWTAVNALDDDLKHQEFLLKLLTSRDSFIRKRIIEQNLNFLNFRLSNYLSQLGLPHTVCFKSDLTVEIMQFGQDLDFDNLSRGERNRVIIGLSFAFRDVWESLYDSINLLFVDELLDNGLDIQGVENALALLKNISRERNKNVYLISHRDELLGRVSNVLTTYKENGFTHYVDDSNGVSSY